MSFSDFSVYNGISQRSLPFSHLSTEDSILAVDSEDEDDEHEISDFQLHYPDTNHPFRRSWATQTEALLPPNMVSVSTDMETTPEAVLLLKAKRETAMQLQELHKKIQELLQKKEQLESVQVPCRRPVLDLTLDDDFTSLPVQKKRRTID